MGNSFINGAPQALEHTDLPIPTSTASRAVPTSVAADRSRTPHTLVQYWLRMRLHDWRHRAAREVTKIRATETAPPAALGLPRTRREYHEGEEHDRTCGGGRRCCSRRVPLGGVPAPEARRPRGHARGGEDPANTRRAARRSARARTA